MQIKTYVSSHNNYKLLKCKPEFHFTWGKWRYDRVTTVSPNENKLINKLLRQYLDNGFNFPIKLEMPTKFYGNNVIVYDTDEKIIKELNDDGNSETITMILTNYRNINE